MKRHRSCPGVRPTAPLSHLCPPYPVDTPPGSRRLGGQVPDVDTRPPLQSGCTRNLREVKTELRPTLLPRVSVSSGAPSTSSTRQGPWAPLPGPPGPAQSSSTPPSMPLSPSRAELGPSARTTTVCTHTCPGFPRPHPKRQPRAANLSHHPNL